MRPDKTNSTSACRLCGRTVARWFGSCRPGVDLFRCPACHVDFARYNSLGEPDTQDHFQGLDLDKYMRSVKRAREASYAQLLSRVRKYATQGRWLDVGCSYGWLLSYVNTRGFEGQGIEPSASAAQHAIDAGIPVRVAGFPDSGSDAESFEVVSFMDVLEHLESPAEILGAIRRRLVPDGILIIQVPDRASFLYRLARQLHWLSLGRIRFALSRLWLADLDFPHHYYFTLEALRMLLHEVGFEILEYSRPAMGHPSQALDRVSYTGKSSAGWNLLVGSVVACIQALDSACGHGGLLTVIARPLSDTGPAQA